MNNYLKFHKCLVSFEMPQCDWYKNLIPKEVNQRWYV